MSRLGTLGAKLYNGEVSYDFVGKRRRWYMISAAIVIVAIAALAFRGLNYGIEFKGGADFVVPTTASNSVETARTAVESAGVREPIVTQLGDDRVRVQTEPLSANQTNQVSNALAEAFSIDVNEIKVQLVGPSWGGDITQKAIQALIVFILLVMLFLSLYFEWRMAIAAIVALAHDVVITVGVYALLGLEVTPATVIGVLTILGYSLYDTVVVFDKVKENTRGIAAQSRMTYSQAANLALNQTLVRSINTSIVALLPVAAILVVGVGFLGAGTLLDLALALFVGMLAGTYSSVFIATPVLCDLKERDPAMKAVAARVAARQSGLTAKAGRKGAKGAAGAGGSEPDDDDLDEAPAARTVAVADMVDPAAEAAVRGPRNQPRRSSRSKRGPGKG